MNTARMLLAVLALSLVSCGGGGAEEDVLIKAGDPVGEPPCKSIPIEQRQAECGT